MRDSIKLITSLGFGSVLLLMFIVVFIALSELKALNGHMSTLVDETNAKIEAAATMRDAIRLRALSLQAMQLNDDPFFRDEQLMRFNGYAGAYRVARDSLLNTHMGVRERVINQRLTEMTRIAQPFNDRAAELLIDDASAEQIQAAVKTATSHQLKVLDVLDELVQLEKDNVRRATTKSALHYRETRQTLFILTACTLLFSGLISLSVIRHAAAKNHKISYQACHDSLTGLLNRRVFEGELKALVDSAQKNNSSHALLYIDLDQFKIVNDTCGHMAGDKLLCQLTLMFNNSLRNSDIVARLGGDEFGVLIKNCPLQAAIRVAENIREQVAEYRFEWEQKTFSPGLSIGIVPINAKVDDFTRVLSTADMACLYAKQSGRNRVHVAATDDREVAGYLGEMEWVGRINSALEQGHFRLFYQKVIPLAAGQEDDGHIEVLVRMVNPDGELVPPCAFIPAAERYHLMSAIDRWVVGNTVQWLERNSALSARQKTMINLSGQSICN